jgi:hypothetical protein
MLSSGDPSTGTEALNAERLRMRSKVLFGNMDRLVVAVAIAESPDGLVNATDLGWQLGLANNRVRAQLVAFADAGLLRAPPDGGGGKRWYVRLESPFWSACRHLASTWSD